MKTIVRAAVIAALLLAWVFSGADRTPRSMLSLGIPSAEAAPGREPNEKLPHDLSALSLFNKVIVHVRDNYVDPKRIKPKEMMIASLEAVEKTVPDVLVDGSAEQQRLKVVVNGKPKEFDLSHVDSLWKMTFTLHDVLDFVAKNMRPIEDTREVEYAAINGMLQTLDPHSVLLRPEMYREMKITTKGEFGGLGFVIQMREGVLTVVKVLPKTPAFRAGIKKDDQITRIGDESTVNMDLNEAVSKLRGPVDSRVTITLMRRGWDKPQVQTVTRALISIESVQSKLLSQGVGYVRLKNFQGNTTQDLHRALADMAEAAKGQGFNKGLSGLVLDLRGNPGGLLDQAISVSDTFVSSGTIVSTVGLSDKLRETKPAHQDPDDEQYPIVVLVNAGSASASEIVAGALKNLNRAVIVGRQSFGKGSVQVLYDFADDSALKLTIAKYLTPGDVSIQEIGITPDVQLIPTRVSKDRVDVFAPRRVVGEADLDKHFGNPENAQAAKKRDEVVVREKPLESLKYLKTAAEKIAKAEDKDAKDGKEPKDKKDGKEVASKDGKDGKKAPPPAKGGKNLLTDSEHTPEEDLDDQMDAESQDEVREDFEVTFAREFLLAAPYTQRDRMLKAGRNFILEKRQVEEQRIAQAITAQGVDWTAGPTPKAPQLLTTLKPSADKKIQAGETIQLELTVENKGAEAVKRLRAWTESENGYLDRREFVFGALAPGEKRSWSVPVKFPKDLASRRDGVTVKLQDDSGQLAEALAGELTFVELPRPQFAYTWSLVDDCADCNGDGLAQRGEAVTLFLDVTNTGSGKALDTFGNIKNAADTNIFIEKGRFKLGEIAPGETKAARFQLQVKKAYKADEFALRLWIGDEPLEEFLSDKLVLPVAGDATPPVALEASTATARIAERAQLFASASPQGRVLGTLAKGATLPEQARGNGMVRVELEKGRSAFVKLGDVRGSGKSAPLANVEWLPARAPAQISMNVDPSQGGMVVETDKLTLSSVVVDPNLLDVFVLVNDQKVFFKARTPEDGDRVKFTTDVPLKEGNNLVTVVARESQDFAARKSVVVRRRPAAVAQTTPDKPPAQAKP